VPFQIEDHLSSSEIVAVTDMVPKPGAAGDEVEGADDSYVVANAFGG
jgi:hypothetical protein